MIIHTYIHSYIHRCVWVQVFLVSFNYFVNEFYGLSLIHFLGCLESESICLKDKKVKKGATRITRSLQSPTGQDHIGAKKGARGSYDLFENWKRPFPWELHRRRQRHRFWGWLNISFLSIHLCRGVSIPILN